MSKLHAIVLAAVILALALPATSQLIEPEQRRPEKPSEIPGNYTIGFYSDAKGSTGPVKIEKGITEFDMWLGVTGDSMRVFSGLAMSIDLPYGVEPGGPIVWSPRDGLRTSGVFLDPGVTVEFHDECARQTGSAPVMLARIPMKILAGINEAVITPKKHSMFGLSVELCSEERLWPKPTAQPVSLTVKRKLSLWDRITGLFD